MDWAAKPSLARYDMRPDSVDFSSKDAADNDVAMLAALDSQLDVAAKRMREGHTKQALELLRRSHKLVSKFEAPSPKGEVPLVVRFASATVRLQTCCLLSQLGEHHRALQEVDAAKKELDSIWWTMIGATKEAEAMSATGQFCLLDAALQTHITNPPRWLPRAIDTAIQIRLCRAVELEYVASDSQILAALEASAALDQGKPLPLLSHQRTNAGQEIAEEDIPDRGMPVAELSFGQDLAQEYHQAWQLCLRLLPRGSPILLDAERAIWHARVRWQTIAGSAGEAVSDALFGKSSSSALNKSFSEPALTRAPAELPPIVGFAKSIQPKHSWEVMHGSKDSWDSVMSGSTKYNESISALFGDSRSSSMDEQSEWIETFPRGDVFARSVRSSIPSKGSPLDRNRISPKKQKPARAQTASPDSTQKGEKDDESEKNIFADWLKNNLHKNRMTGFQHKLQSYEGIGILQGEMRREKHGLRQELAHMDDERLADNRVLYTSHGLQATRIGNKRRAAIRKTSIQPTDRAKAILKGEKAMYQYYGLEVPECGSTAQSLKKLMEACRANDPDKVKRRKQREEERKQAKEAEQRKTLKLKAAGGGDVSGQLLFAARGALFQQQDKQADLERQIS